MDTQKLVSEIRREQNELSSRVAWLRKAITEIVPILAKCSDTLKADFSIGITYLHVYNRDDLQLLMAMAPIWTKQKEGKRIVYMAQVRGKFVYIHAYENALPPTCRVVTETKMVPAGEAHEETTETIVCDTPLS